MPPRFQLDEDDDSPGRATAFIKAPESAYQTVYSPTRQYLRHLVAKEVEREIPLLAAIQHRFRTSFLDQFFVYSGMLGNHSFFMLALPFLHIFGLGKFARGLSFVVLWSIYFSGIAKDYISAPRPKNPPVVQITRSPAHTLEYGFPSTHTTYVLATITYISYFMLNVWETPLIWAICLWICGLIIVVGRIYCGLHSFIDVAGGAIIGILEALAFIGFYDHLDNLFPTTAGPLYMSAILYVALTTLPRSLDLCPCCIDTVCATSVTLGLSFGCWGYARMPFLWHNGRSDYIAWDHTLTLWQNFIRCAISLVLVVVWKIVSKPLMISVVKLLFPNIGIASKHAKGMDDNAAKNNAFVVPSPSNIKCGRYGSYALMVTHENLARIPIYCGISLMVCVVSPICFYLLGIMPSP
ncbi:Long-chain base-1-phosphate phosphatase [Coemansia brasiliensis]|uniref:Long-chain base-1-phosphate phosphatase n=1 Tax=Coemansia brasiliensis TaxID=2650707 RepID=A0A9W8I748_9FUNG|nr:Long-chain base-1-phosphate phosphatase [Coemansia brasiliensis]